MADVLAYSRAHAMVNRWDFLTGSLPQLQGDLDGVRHLRQIDPVRSTTLRPCS